MRVLLTKTAIDCILDIKNHSQSKYSDNVVSEFIDTMVNNIITDINLYPTRFPFNVQLLDFGLKCREKYFEDYRCLYEIKNNTAYILLILHTKQDIESALYRHIILRDL